MEEGYRVPHIGANPLPQGEELGHELVHTDGGLVVQVLKEHIFQLYSGGEPLPEPGLVKEVAHLDARFGVLVGVEGGDALLGGAVLLICKALLFQVVQITVPGQKQAGPVADLQIFRGDGDALGHHVLHLRPEALAVHGHAVAQDVHHPVPKNAGGQQMQGEFALFVHHRVSGVAAALVADHYVVVLRQQVHHAALALVAPVDAYNGAV